MVSFSSYHPFEPGSPLHLSYFSIRSIAPAPHGAEMRSLYSFFAPSLPSSSLSSAGASSNSLELELVIRSVRLCRLFGVFHFCTYDHTRSLLLIARYFVAYIWPPFIAFPVFCSDESLSFSGARPASPGALPTALL